MVKKKAKNCSSSTCCTPPKKCVKCKGISSLVLGLLIVLNAYMN